MSSKNTFYDLTRWFSLNGFWDQRVDFYRHVATALEDNEQFVSYIDGELEIALAPKTADPDKAAGLRYLQKLRDTEGLVLIEDLLPAVMPATDAMGLSVLRNTFDKPAALRYLADNIEQERAMLKTARSAMSSPLLLLVGAFLMALIISMMILPVLEKVAPAEIWKGFPALFRSVTHAVRDWGPTFAGLLLVSVVWLFVWGLPNMTVIWRYRMESATRKQRIVWALATGPMQSIFAVYRDVQSARMLANLATLLRVGQQIRDAVENLAHNATPWMRRHLVAVLEHLDQEPGDHVGAFSQGVLSPALLGRMHTMLRRDAGGAIEKALIEVGTAGQVQAREDVQRYATRLNLAALVAAVSLVVFFMAGTVFVSFEMMAANSPAAIMRRHQQKTSLAPAPTPITSISSTSHSTTGAFA
jgi:hypothetical protein